MPKTNFNKVLTLWTYQTYMENMSTALKPDEISFGVLLFRQKLCQFRTFLKLLPIDNFHQIEFSKASTPSGNFSIFPFWDMVS